ncbi:hypothetical protein EYC84_007704 [Monilinia fructicola]|uniref:Uncharacterized protein n=1 Tax=Monilinia fructicola TaxID=38448 RepID=A0A5M9JJZ7_MONFR|nr:hypothetical protein EYC84_007704 [Monilinia fructicola]
MRHFIGAPSTLADLGPLITTPPYPSTLFPYPSLLYDLIRPYLSHHLSQGAQTRSLVSGPPKDLSSFYFNVLIIIIIFCFPISRSHHALASYP